MKNTNFISKTSVKNARNTLEKLEAKNWFLDLTNETKRKLIEGSLNMLNDNNPKVVNLAFTCVDKILTDYVELFEPFVDSLFEQLVSKMSDTQVQTRLKARNLMVRLIIGLMDLCVGFDRLANELTNDDPTTKEELLLTIMALYESVSQSQSAQLSHLQNKPVLVLKVSIVLSDPKDSVRQAAITLLVMLHGIYGPSLFTILESTAVSPVQMEAILERSKTNQEGIHSGALIPPHFTLLVNRSVSTDPVKSYSNQDSDNGRQMCDIGDAVDFEDSEISTTTTTLNIESCQSHKLPPDSTDANTAIPITPPWFVPFGLTFKTDGLWVERDSTGLSEKEESTAFHIIRSVLMANVANGIDCRLVYHPVTLAAIVYVRMKGDASLLSEHHAHFDACPLSVVVDCGTRSSFGFNPEMSSLSVAVFELEQDLRRESLSPVSQLELIHSLKMLLEEPCMLMLGALYSYETAEWTSETAIWALHHSSSFRHFIPHRSYSLPVSHQGIPIIHLFGNPSELGGGGGGLIEETHYLELASWENMQPVLIEVGMGLYVKHPLNNHQIQCSLGVSINSLFPLRTLPFSSDLYLTSFHLFRGRDTISNEEAWRLPNRTKIESKAVVERKTPIIGELVDLNEDQHLALLQLTDGVRHSPRVKVGAKASMPLTNNTKREECEASTWSGWTRGATFKSGARTGITRGTVTSWGFELNPLFKDVQYVNTIDHPRVAGKVLVYNHNSVQSTPQTPVNGNIKQKVAQQPVDHVYYPDQKDSFIVVGQVMSGASYYGGQSGSRFADTGDSGSPAFIFATDGSGSLLGLNRTVYFAHESWVLNRVDPLDLCALEKWVEHAVAAHHQSQPAASESRIQRIAKFFGYRR